MRKIEIKINNVFDWTECDMKVNCLGMDKASIVFERDKDQIFYRQSFNGSLTFNDKLVNGIQVFTKVSTLNLSVADERTRVLLRVTLDDVVWYGFFTPRNCNWDYNRRTFTVNPKTDDVYEPFLSADRKVNLFTLSEYTVGIDVGVGTLVCSYARKLSDALGLLITNHTWSDQFSLLAIESGFLNDANNPVTGGTNYWKGMLLGQKTDVLRANEPDIEHATVLTFSFESFFEFMRNYLNVYWDLEFVSFDADGKPRYNFVIEHYSYFEAAGTIHDLTETTGTTATDKFYYDEDNVPKSLTIRIDAPPELPPYNGVPIEYISGLTGDEKEVSIKDFVTCLELKQLSTSNEGFFIICAELDGVTWDYKTLNADYTVMPLNPSIFTGVYPNGYLAHSYVVDKFWRHGQYYPYAKMNEIANVFNTVKPSILQDLQLKKCVAFDSNDVCETTLTAILGEYGKIEKAEYRVNGGTVLSLAYKKDFDNLITLNAGFGNTEDGGAKKSTFFATIIFYPMAAVSMRINALITFDDDSTVCLDLSIDGSTEGGETLYDFSYNDVLIVSVVYFVELPVGYQILSNVPLEEAEVCT